jgi:hypothetical protein
VHDDLVFWLPFAPGLLVYDPHAGPCSGTCFGGLLRNNEFQSRHGFEAAFEELAGCQVLRHIRIIEPLLEQDLVVGRPVEEWRLGEVVEHAVAVNAHLEVGRRAPLDLVQRRTRVWRRIGGHI